jgi:hypothetical protein
MATKIVLALNLKNSSPSWVFAIAQYQASRSPKMTPYSGQNARGKKELRGRFGTAVQHSVMGWEPPISLKKGWRHVSSEDGRERIVAGETVN